MRKLLLIVGATTRDHFQIIGRRDVVKDGKKQFYVDIRCEKCGKEIKNVRTSNLPRRCKNHDTNQSRMLEVGDTTRGHFLITAKYSAERNGKKRYFVNLKCEICGAELNNILVQHLSRVCKQHDTEKAVEGK